MNSDIISEIIVALIGAFGTIMAATISAPSSPKDGNSQSFDSGADAKGRIHRKWPIISVIILQLVTIAYFIQPKKYPTDGVIASFSTGTGGQVRNRFDEVFTPISDSEWNGQSTCWYEIPWSVVDNDKSNNPFLRIHFDLNNDEGNPYKKLKEAYIGLFTDFSYPPAEPFDVSEFKGLEIRIRVTPDKSTGISNEDIYVHIILADSAIPPKPGIYDFPEARINPDSLQDNAWSTIRVDFSDFKPPSFSTRPEKIALSKNKVFRLGLSIKSKKSGKGYVDFDDIRFFH